ncbi:DUF692 domain-containing protein [Paraferrimonas sp. SM1919]|uniref:HvfB family MNIO-type RiPP peptide maturase n=1 Tax=Paraferrimonas sp. SM1919 TaxID=2662263 RepID=UPI0013D25ECC|nr:DUF692 domain-containing protein [Paraferrimonas sp. SM1919]
MKSKNVLQGAGLGLRREFLDECLNQPPNVDFFEVAPENWMTLGGHLKKQFRALTERHTFALHGLSLSIGSSDPLDVDFVKGIKRFMALHNIDIYSEHLSYCSHNGHMYDLMPLPFTEEAVMHVANRVKQVQDIIERPLILENVSFYSMMPSQMTEAEFTLAVLQESGARLLLDVNNVYVNSINHHYDPYQFIDAMPRAAIQLMHVAGHYDEAEDLKVDTHGSAVIDPVWQLLKHAYLKHGLKPTLLERDFNIPPMHELQHEINMIKHLQQQPSLAKPA